MKAFDLEGHLGQIGRFAARLARTEGAVHAVAAHQDDVADFAAVNSVGQLLHRPAVTRHESHPDFQPLGLGGLAELEHLLGSRPVGGQGLFHENVQPLLDGVGEVHPAEGQRSGEDRDVARLKAVHSLFVSVETEELAIVGHIDSIAEVPLQSAVRVGEAILKDIGQGHQLHRRRS